MPADKPSAPRNRPARAIAPVVLVIVALLAAAWLLVASAAYHRSFAPVPVTQRASDADLASSMEPWNASYARRSLVLDNWDRGAQALAQGDYSAAIAALDIAYRNDIGDAELLALYHKAQDVQALESNRKAHLQHGHEGPGGTLQPSQVER